MDNSPPTGKPPQQCICKKCIKQRDQLAVDLCYQQAEKQLKGHPKKDFTYTMYPQYLDQILKEANEGNKKACYLMGRYYDLYVGCQPQKALNWYALGTKYLEKHSMFELYWGGKLDKNKAVKQELFQKALSQRQHRALLQRGKMCIYQLQKQSIGQFYWKIAADDGNGYICHLLGKYYYQKGDYQKCLYYQKKAYQINPQQFDICLDLIVECEQQLGNIQDTTNWRTLLNNRSKRVKKDNRKMYQQAIFYKKNVQNVFLIHNYWRLSQIYYSSGSPNEGFKCMEISNKLSPKQHAYNSRTLLQINEHFHPRE